MNKIKCFAVLLSAVLLSGSLYADDLKNALRLYEDGMLVRSRTLFNDIQKSAGSEEPEGWSVLCDVLMKTVGYEGRMADFVKSNPHSVLIPQIRYAYAANLFDEKQYKAQRK